MIMMIIIFIMHINIFQHLLYNMLPYTHIHIINYRGKQFSAKLLLIGLVFSYYFPN